MQGFYLLKEIHSVNSSVPGLKINGPRNELINNFPTVGSFVDDYQSP